MKKGSSVVSKIFFVFIVLGLIDNFVDIRGNFLSGGSFVWIFPLVAGFSVFSSWMKDDEDDEQEIDETNQTAQKAVVKEEKNEYDFDDEFAIDPKDYE